MLRLSYRAALVSVTLLALLPTVIAMTIFDGPAWLADSPFTARMLSIAALASLAALLVIIFVGFRAKVESPLSFTLVKIKETPSLVVAPAFLILLSIYPSRAFSYLKDAIPSIVPFYLDPWLVTADRWLFFGNDPWRISHALFGPYGTIVLDKVYIAWFSLIPLLAVWICASRDRNFQLRGLLTLFFIWIVLGNYAALALSSAGPVFYEEFYGSDYYAPLMAEIYRANEIAPLAMLPIAQTLLELRNSGMLGSGISAMPSVHVAIAYLAFIIVWDRYRTRAAVAIAGGFLVLIFIGSFHLAWHYAWDGIVSIIAVWAFWRLLGFVEIEPAEAVANSLTADQEA